MMQRTSKRMLTISLLWLAMPAVLLGLCGWGRTEEEVQAASKSKITCTLEDGTLTIRGKGKLKCKDVTVTGKKKICSVKKIVVEKGITSIPESAFYSFQECKEVEIAETVKTIGDDALPRADQLDKVTLPGTFELATYEYVMWKEQANTREWGQWWEWSQLLNSHVKIDTICFNTKLSLKTLSWVQSRNLIVSDQDQRYKSIDGVIYTKDGKSIVRVPSDRTSLTVDDRCEEFCLSAVLYARQDGDEEKGNCEQLRQLVLPKSIKKVERKKYAAFKNGSISLDELVVQTKVLDSESVFALTNAFSNLKEESIYNQLESVSVQDGMYLNANDDCLLRYLGSASEITVPEGITKIGQQAFYQSNIKKINIPDAVTKINPWAFAACGRLSQIRLPANLTEIPAGMLDGCKKLKNIRIPNGVTTIGAYAFYDTKCTDITLPAKVKKVGEDAFDRKCKNVTIKGAVPGFDANAFYISRNTILHFKTGIRDQATWMVVTGMGGAREWNLIDFEWLAIAGVDGWQIQVSKTKSFQNKQTYYAGKKQTKISIENKKIDMRYVRIRPYQKKGKEKTYGRWRMTKV